MWFGLAPKAKGYGVLTIHVVWGVSFIRKELCWRESGRAASLSPTYNSLLIHRYVLVVLGAGPARALHQQNIMMSSEQVEGCVAVPGTWFRARCGHQPTKTFNPKQCIRE